jgi:hypothetical protein
VRLLRTADLSVLRELEPAYRPRRLGFSPQGNYLVIEAHQGWVADYLAGVDASAGARLDSSAATRDDIQRAEVWNLHTGQSIAGLACDAVATTAPKGGWLWARDRAITPGYRSAALLTAYFGAEESEFSMLCWNGVRQRWDSRDWQRLADVPPPPGWEALMHLTTAQWLAGSDVASRLASGRHLAMRVRSERFGFGTVHVWDLKAGTEFALPGDCDSRVQPVQALAEDARRIVAVCARGLGQVLRAWDLAPARELPLRGAAFGMTSNPTIRAEGIALSPDGRMLAVALLDLTEALIVTPVPAPLATARSDLRIWSVDDGRELASLPIDELDGVHDYFRGIDVTFSPDATLLAVAGRRLRIYRVADLAPAAGT